MFNFCLLLHKSSLWLQNVSNLRLLLLCHISVFSLFLYEWRGICRRRGAVRCRVSSSELTRLSATKLFVMRRSRGCRHWTWRSVHNADVRGSASVAQCHAHDAVSQPPSSTTVRRRHWHLPTCIPYNFPRNAFYLLIWIESIKSNQSLLSHDCLQPKKSFILDTTEAIGHIRFPIHVQICPS